LYLYYTKQSFSRQYPKAGIIQQTSVQNIRSTCSTLQYARKSGKISFFGNLAPQRMNPLPEEPKPNPGSYLLHFCAFSYILFFELKKVSERPNPADRKAAWMQFLNADSEEDFAGRNDP